jgi:calcium-dependent protein kinase
MLGSGAFGSVYKTANIANPKHFVAIKVLNKKNMAENLAYVMEEVSILNTLDHPNIVKYYETYDDNKYVYLVMEYISGMQLFQKIT